MMIDNLSEFQLVEFKRLFYLYTLNMSEIKI